MTHHFGQPAIGGLEQLTGQLMLLERVTGLHDGGAMGRYPGIIGQTGAWSDFVQGIFHGTVAQVVPMLHAVNTQHGLQRMGPSAIARLGIKRLIDFHHVCHGRITIVGRGKSFSGLTALSAEFTIGEGELMAHDVLWDAVPDEHDDLLSELFAPSCLSHILQIRRLFISI